MPVNANKKYFSTRTVVNSKKCFVQSRDWKQDWWFCNNVSYADVVKNKCKSVSKVRVQSIDGPEVQGVEKHRNTRTQGECIADKNIKSYCSKNITPTGSHMAWKRSLSKVNTSIASGTKTKDTNSQCSRVKTNKKLQTTMIQYPNSKNGQRCDSGDNSHVINDGFAQRCEFPVNGQSRTSQHDNRTQGLDNYATSVKNRFWPLCTEDSVKHSSHGHEFLKGPGVSDNKSVKKASTRFTSNSKCQSPSVNNRIQCPNQGSSQDTVVSPEPTATVNSNQNSSLTDPDKYALDLRFRPRHRLRIQEAKDCHTFKLWDAQMSDKFGYIPLQDQIIPDKDHKRGSTTDVLKMHDIISKSETYNFLHCQIQVKSELNADVWEQYLGEYWDTQLKFLIRYGFPLDFNKNVQLSHKLGNHGSGNKFPEDIKAYLSEEMEHNAILGPFHSPPITDLHISPFMTREKPGAPHRRVIIDLSFPAGQSVNAGVNSEQYLGSKFLLTLPTIDTITSKLVKLGRGALIYKIDISRAFRHVKIDPADYKYLGLHFQDYFLDSCLPFGFRHGSAIFQRLSDAVRYIMATRGHNVTNYIDDIIGYAVKSQAQASFDNLYNLLQDLGFKISKNKLVEPTTRATCLGVELDTEKFTVAVPQDKLNDIRQECTQWLSKRSCNKRQLQSLLGKLLYVTKCVRASRPFLNRMLDTLRAAHKQDTIIIDREFRRDLNWFTNFLPKFNGVAFFSHTPIHTHVELDASLQGLGAMCGQEIYAIALPKGYHNYNIVHLEMINILVAVRTWAHQWQGRKVVIHCDNQAVVSVLTSGHTRDMTLAAIARNISMITAFRDIDLITVHIEGKLNIIADTLSRLSINPALIHKIPQLVPGHIWVNPSANVLTLDWSI